MDKKSLTSVCICVLVLLVLVSLSSVVGYQMIQSSHQKIINEDVSLKELLFQTIVDMTNNNEIQGLLLKSQVGKAMLFRPDVQISLYNTHVLTKNQLKQMYLVGLALSKFISRSRIHSMYDRYQGDTQWIRKEISNVIENNATLNKEMLQLSSFNCNCENENTTQWSFPLLCLLLIPFLIISIVYLFLTSDPELIITIEIIGYKLHCSWYSP
jgi:hypothetical protein